MWSSASQRIDNSNKVTLREVLLYMVDNSKWRDAILVERYRRDLGDDQAELPEKVV